VLPLPLKREIGAYGRTKWKPSCKTNTAAFSFEGICADPRVMANMLGVEDATKFKVKKSASLYIALQW
jgi:hypothetical protein